MSWLDRIDIELSGGCQCGAVRYHATQRLDNAHICHCRMCQKAMGSFFAPLVGFPVESFTWTRGEPSIFMSSEHVQRGFCSQCGTPLFYRNENNPRIAHDHRLARSSRAGRALRPGRQREQAAVLRSARRRCPVTRPTEQDDPEDVPKIKATNHQHPDHDTEVLAR